MKKSLVVVYITLITLFSVLNYTPSTLLTAPPPETREPVNGQPEVKGVKGITPITKTKKMPTSLSVEFDDPFYPNHTEVFVNITFTIKVKITAAYFNYTNVKATLTLDASPTEQHLFFINETSNQIINNTRSLTKTLGNLTTTENGTLTWKAIPLRYDPTEYIRLIRVNATGMRAGIVSINTPLKYLNVDINQPILSVTGPTVDNEGPIAFILKNEEAKVLKINITSLGNYPLQKIEINVIYDEKALKIEALTSVSVDQINLNTSYSAFTFF